MAFAYSVLMACLFPFFNMFRGENKGLDPVLGFSPYCAHIKDRIIRISVSWAVERETTPLLLLLGELTVRAWNSF